MKKDFFVRCRVNNSGLDFEDDVDVIVLTVSDDIKISDVLNVIGDADKYLRAENEDGDCKYDELGWNCTTLMDTVCNGRDWEWKHLPINIDFEIR